MPVQQQYVRKGSSSNTTAAVETMSGAKANGAIGPLGDPQCEALGGRSGQQFTAAIARTGNTTSSASAQSAQPKKKDLPFGG